MDETACDEAAALLQDAAGGTPLRALPAGRAPETVAEALAIQDRLVARSRRPVAGWKVSTDPDGAVMYGAIYAEDCFASPASVDHARFPLMGIEGEVAYRFQAALPSRPEPYSRGELERVLAPFPAIEIVQSRFADYGGTPAIHRLADRMSNGGMVLGEAVATGAAGDLAAVPVTLSVDGTPVVDRRGGHGRGDPLLPALDFIAAVQHRMSFAAGQFITTGTFTGLIFGRSRQSFHVRFAGLGECTLTVT